MPRQYHFPEGRIGTTRLMAIMGWSRSTMWERRAKNPLLDHLLDAKIDDRGLHTFDEAKAIQLARKSEGTPTPARAARAAGGRKRSIATKG